MLDWFWHLIIYTVPWQVWAVLAGFAALIVFIMIRFAVGFRGALVLVFSGLLVAAAAILHQRGQQQGWQDRQKAEQKDADKTLDKAHEARRDAAARDPSRLRDNDGFRVDD